MAKLKRKAFRVSVVMPTGATAAQIRDYIADRICTETLNGDFISTEFEDRLTGVKVTALREPR